jgi:hypothetical protein
MAMSKQPEQTHKWDLELEAIILLNTGETIELGQMFRTGRLVSCWTVEDPPISMTCRKKAKREWNKTQPNI